MPIDTRQKRASAINTRARRRPGVFTSLAGSTEPKRRAARGGYAFGVETIPDTGIDNRFSLILYCATALPLDFHL